MLLIKALTSLIEDASCPMMWNEFFRSRIDLFLARIVQEEVNQDRVDVSFRMGFDDLAPNQLDRPNAASAELDLPTMTVFNRDLLMDAIAQRRTEG